MVAATYIVDWDVLFLFSGFKCSHFIVKEIFRMFMLVYHTKEIVSQKKKAMCKLTFAVVGPGLSITRQISH